MWSFFCTLNIKKNLKFKLKNTRGKIPLTKKKRKIHHKSYREQTASSKKPSESSLRVQDSNPRQLCQQWEKKYLQSERHLKILTFRPKLSQNVNERCFIVILVENYFGILYNLEKNYIFYLGRELNVFYSHWG